MAFATRRLIPLANLQQYFFYPMSDYSEKLQNGNWQRRRIQILQRDDFRCTICGSDQKLEVHHLDYLEGIQVWEHPNDMLVTLCRKCHEKEQPRYKVERHLIDTLKMKGFMIGDLLAFNSMLQTRKDFTLNLLKAIGDFQSQNPHKP